jgi:hypothetical protein
MKPRLFFSFRLWYTAFQQREDEIANNLLKKKIEPHLFV